MKVEYKCDLCHNRYDNKREAEECERSHIKIKSIIPFCYTPPKDSMEGGPLAINVIFENGTEVTYFADYDYDYKKPKNRLAETDKKMLTKYKVIIEELKGE